MDKPGGHYANEISQTEKDKYYMISHVQSEKVELTKAETKMVFASNEYAVGELRTCWSKEQTFSCKMRQYWRSNVEYGD